MSSSIVTPEELARLLRVEQKARAFEARYTSLESVITGAFAFQQLHGCAYNGPTYEVELREFREALKVDALQTQEEPQVSPLHDVHGAPLAGQLVEAQAPQRAPIGADREPLSVRMASQRMKSRPHAHTGNCWEIPTLFKCRECGSGNRCDVCHEHDEPRFACQQCARCKSCDQDAES